MRFRGCPRLFAGRPGAGIVRFCSAAAATLLAGGRLSAAVADGADGDAVASACWGDFGGFKYSFDFCCRAIVSTERGHPSCWHQGFTYESCCMREMYRELDERMDLINQGDFRSASFALFDLHLNFASQSGDNYLRSRSFAAFEKATVGFRNGLDDMPKQVSWFDVLFHGMGIKCEAPQAESVTPSSKTVFSEFNRCCSGLNQPCMQIFEMVAQAVGHRAKRDGEDKYYNDFSEQWAFHHFTPSLLLSTDVKSEPLDNLDLAFKLDANIAGALTADGEPMLGIVWAEHSAGYRSPKFCYGAHFLTLLMKKIFVEGGEQRPLELFEVGAGYGSLPRIVAGARQRLLNLARPINVQRYTVLDVRSVIDLQQWYLQKTLGPLGQVQEWSVTGADATISDLRPEAPLRVELVERNERDLYIHSYGQASLAAAKASGQRSVRALIAVNSWHEMPLSEYFWYYNTFIAGPESLAAIDWIFYVSNRAWIENAEKEQLLFGPGPGQQFKIREKQCGETNCMFLLQRSA